MKTVLKSKEILLTAEGSRFLAQLWHINSREEAQEIIQVLWKAHPRATHIVSAVRLVQEGYYDDDAEPSQTAGAPLLALLEGEELIFALLTCVRYFGGTKLGKGGLIRSYSEAGREAIRQASLVPLHFVKKVYLTYDYSYQLAMSHLLSLEGVFQGTIQYGADIRACVYLKQPVEFLERYLNGTQGRGLIEQGDWVYIYLMSQQVFERGTNEREN